MINQPASSQKSPIDPARLSDFLLLASPAAMMIALLLRPFRVHDLGWQIKLGELMVAKHSPFIVERFNALHLGESLVPNAWLAQVAYFLINTAGGWTALRITDAMLWLSGIFVAALPGWRRNDRPLAIVLSVIVAFVVGLPSAMIRPQSFAALSFGLFLLLLKEAEKKWSAVLLLAPLLVLWQNLHPSVPVAFLIAASLAGLRWLQVLLRGGAWPLRLTIISFAAGCAIFATPAGWEIIPFSQYHTDVSRSFGATEWFPLWHPANQQFALAVILSALGAGWTILRFRASASLIEVVPFALTLILSIYAARFILFYSIALVPVFNLLPLGAARSSHIHHSKCLAGIMGLAAVIAVEAMVIPINVERQIPLQVLNDLRKKVGDGLIVNDPMLSGSLIYIGSPGWKLLYDGRYYLLAQSEIRLLKRIRAGQASLAELERQFKPIAFALVKSNSPALIAEIERHPETWHLEYSDPWVVFISRRRNP